MGKPDGPGDKPDDESDDNKPAGNKPAGNVDAVGDKPEGKPDDADDMNKPDDMDDMEKPEGFDEECYDNCMEKCEEEEGPPEKPTGKPDTVAPTLPPVKNPCDNPKLFKCPPKTECQPNPLNDRGFECVCPEGTKDYGDGCKPKPDVIDVTDETKCPKDFQDRLLKLKFDKKNPPKEIFESNGNVIMKMQTNKNLPLNENTYTAFAEFTRANCGGGFIKELAAGNIKFMILDGKKSSGLYSIIGQHGVYLANENNFDGASGGVVQFTKNFKTLGEMLDDDTMFEIEQRAGNANNMLPKKDTFLMFIKGKYVNREQMSKFYDTCFDPARMNLFIYKGAEKYSVETRDFTKCFYRSKLEKYEGKECQNAAVFNGEETDSKDFIDVLMSDIPICKIPKPE